MRVWARPLSEGRFGSLTVFAVALLILLGGLATILINEVSYRASRDQQAMVQAEVLAASVAAPLDFGDSPAAQQAVDAFRANRQVRWIGVYNRGGQAIAGYRRGGGGIAPTLAAAPVETAGAVRVAAPVSVAGQRVGTVVFAFDREPLSRRLSRYLLLGTMLVLAALVVVSLGIAQATLRGANRELGERAEALAQANELLEEQMEERAKAEEQLRQAQKMQALGQLTGGIAHDFNNLLTVIQGSADMLAREQIADDKRLRFANAIVQAANNAAVLTSQLLAFARRQPLKPERLDLNRLVREMDELLDRTMGERIEIRLDLAPTACKVEVDRTQLQSAILNIASNARDAMTGGGCLTIATREAELGDGARAMALAISDTGSGMDADTADRVFEPFFTTKGAGKGTGLGLSQVYGFAQQSGGEVGVASAPGAGSTFTIVLPCCADDSDIAEADAQVAPDGLPPLAILVVEDNEEVGAFAETLLGELGHTVTRAASGEDALALVRSGEHRFDVVFSDVVMPGIGGLKLAETLATERPDLPVVLATGYSQELAQSGSGGRPVILKPYRLATLSEALAGVLKARL